MTDATITITRYIAIWNETDPNRRRDLIAQTWTDDCRYTDPVFEVEGPHGIDAMVAGFHQQFPGLTFVRTGEVEAHHNRIRFTWDLLDATGGRQAAGTDVAVLAPNGQLADVAGFFDMAPVLPGAADLAEEGAIA